MYIPASVSPATKVGSSLYIHKKLSDRENYCPDQVIFLGPDTPPHHSIDKELKQGTKKENGRRRLRSLRRQSKMSPLNCLFLSPILRRSGLQSKSKKS